MFKRIAVAALVAVFTAPAFAAEKAPAEKPAAAKPAAKAGADKKEGAKDAKKRICTSVNRNEKQYTASSVLILAYLASWRFVFNHLTPLVVRSPPRAFAPDGHLGQ